MVCALMQVLSKEGLRGIPREGRRKRVSGKVDIYICGEKKRHIYVRYTLDEYIGNVDEPFHANEPLFVIVTTKEKRPHWDLRCPSL